MAVSNTSNISEVRSFINTLKFTLGYDLIRIGQNNDGGY